MAQFRSGVDMVRTAPSVLPVAGSVSRSGDSASWSTQRTTEGRGLIGKFMVWRVLYGSVISVVPVKITGGSLIEDFLVAVIK